MKTNDNPYYHDNLAGKSLCNGLSHTIITAWSSPFHKVGSG